MVVHDDDEQSIDTKTPVVFEHVEPTGELDVDTRLVCVAGSDLGRTFHITPNGTVIGRGSSAQIQLHSKAVSRQHARIVQHGKRFVIVDLDSANGTIVNGKRVTEAAPLKVGDRIQIGSAILLLTRHDELEERMRRLQRLEAMGTLAGGLAHDFNNALTVISAALEHLHARVRDPELAQVIDDANAATASAAALAKRLLRIDRAEGSTTFEVVGLGKLVEAALSPLRRQATNIAIELDVARDLAVRGSPEELHQVLVNLFVNARDAMPDGGTFAVVARAIHLDAQAALKQQLPGAGDYVELAVTDSGTGMDEDTAGRVFEPFFTTKPRGQGTGLGLAMVHNVVLRHGGTITVDSIPGKGSTFRVMLPAG